MTNLRKILFILILALLTFTPTIAGCAFSGLSCYLFENDVIETPELNIYPESMCLSWNTVTHSNKYQIYMNGTLIDSVQKTNSNSNSLVYDFSEHLTSAGNYKFYIVAVSSATMYSSSEPSNTVTYTCKSAGHVPTFNTVEAIDKNNNVSVTLNGARLSFTALEDDCITDYELYLYSNSSGLKSFSATPNTEINLLLKEYDLVDEIYAIRIGADISGVDTIISDVYYYNPANYQHNFTDKIYSFDGYINDYYITSIPQLKNFIYYMYVYRLPEVQVMLSSDFENLLDERSSNSNANKAEKFQEAILDAYTSFIETEDAYQLAVTLAVPKNRIYKIAISAGANSAIGLDQFVVNESIVPPAELTADEMQSLLQSNYDVSRIYTYLTQAVTEPYYENCNHVMRVNDPQYDTLPYDNFVSDRQFVSQEVESSEELYWAVENKVTPLPVKNSSAEKIYNLAKDTLRNIISDDMTDYEKVLSIFDWICTNTVYDNYSTLPISYPNYYTTNVPAYYLEGVFVTGYAVCDGFSKAFSLMCNMEGIDAIRIVGKKDQYGHAWNKVFLDKDLTDDVDGQYYYVDITWSEFQRAGGYEELSHQYFLVSDKVVDGIPYYSMRTKFANYVANSVYGYYTETTYNYSGKNYDLIIDNYDDLKPMFYHALHENLSIFEVVIDYEFYSDVYEERLDSKQSPFDALADVMRNYKFVEQAFELGWGEWIIYNDEGDEGIVMTFVQEFLIDEGSAEVTHLIDYLDVNNLYGEYKLVVKNNILFASIGETPIEQVQSLFRNTLFNHDVDATFVLVNCEDSPTGESEFVMTITAKQ